MKSLRTSPFALFLVGVLLGILLSALWINRHTEKMKLKHLLVMAGLLAGLHGANPQAANAQNPGGITTAPKAWYKADSITGLANGANVVSWSDSGASGFTLTQATTANQPTYNATGMNGHPTVHFPGTSGVNLKNASISQAQPYTVFVVLKLASVAATEWAMDGGGINSALVGMEHNATNQWANYFNGGTEAFATSVADTAQHVITSEANGTSSTIRVDGGALGTASGGTAGLSGLTIGSRGDGANDLSGDIAEIIIFPGILSSADRVAVQNYLTGKFAATSFQITPQSVPASRTGVKVHLTGSGTSWTSDTTFSATGATATATTFNNAGSVDLTLTTSTAGTITLSDSLDAATQTTTALTASAPDATGILTSPGTYTVAGASLLWEDTAQSAKFNFSGTSAVALVDTSLLAAGGIAAGSYPYLDWSVDGLLWQRAQVTTSGQVTLETGLASATHTLEVRYEPNGETDTWTPANAIRITGWVIDGGAAITAPTGAAAARSKRMMLFGDSITRGYAAANIALQSYGVLLAQGLDAEAGLVGKSGQGWEHAATAGDPAFPTTFDSYYSGQARTFPGNLDYLTVCQGTNDATMSSSDVSTWLTDARAKVGGTCKICVILPYRTQVNASITTGFNTYKAAHPSDPCYLIDPSPYFLPTTEYTIDTYHPTTEGSARLAAILQRLIVAATTPAATNGTKRRLQ